MSKSIPFFLTLLMSLSSSADLLTNPKSLIKTLDTVLPELRQEWSGSQTSGYEINDLICESQLGPRFCTGRNSTSGEMFVLKGSPAVELSEGLERVGIPSYPESHNLINVSLTCEKSLVSSQTSEMYCEVFVLKPCAGRSEWCVDNVLPEFRK